MPLLGWWRKTNLWPVTFPLPEVFDPWVRASGKSCDITLSG